MDNPQPPAPLLASFLSSYSRTRRLEDRIRRLCADAVTISDPTELNSTLEQLTAALQNHIDRLRQVAAMRPTPPERRRS
jgi:hypothetical protein